MMRRMLAFMLLPALAGACAAGLATNGDDAGTGTGGAPATVSGTGGHAATGSGGGTAAGTGGSSGTGGATATGSGGAGGGIPPVNLAGKKALILGDPTDDMVLQQTLTAKGMTVTVAADGSTASTQDLVIVSSSIGQSDAIAPLATAPVPIICFGKDCLAPLGLIPSSPKPASVDGTTQITVVDDTTSLAGEIAAGTSVGVLLPTRSSQYYSSAPTGAPLEVASVMGNASQLVLFAFEKGAATATGTAPARRVAIGWKVNVLGDLTVPAFRLTNEAFGWATTAPD